MKKILSIALVVLMICSTFAFVSCGTKSQIEGKVFVYDSSVLSDSVPEGLVKTAFQATIDSVYKLLVIKFQDGKFYSGVSEDNLSEIGEYTVKGNEITVDGTTMTLKKGKIVFTYEYQSYSAEVYFKKTK